MGPPATSSREHGVGRALANWVSRLQGCARVRASVEQARNLHGPMRRYMWPAEVKLLRKCLLDEEVSASRMRQSALLAENDRPNGATGLTSRASESTSTWCQDVHDSALTSARRARPPPTAQLLA